MKRYNFPNSKNLFVNYNHKDYPELHCHTYWELILITEGNFVHLINNNPHNVKQDTVMLIRPEDKHCLKGTGSYINLGISNDYFLSILSKLFPNQYLTFYDKKYIEFTVAHAFSLNALSTINTLFIFDNKSENYNNILTSLFIDFLKELTSSLILSNIKKQNYSPTIYAIIEKMHSVDSFSLSIEEILKDFHYSRLHLLRLFKKETGLTLSQYFQKIKLNYAKNVLETSNKSITQISIELGFANSSTFSAFFKNEFKTTPSQYKKNWNHYYQSFMDC